MHRDLKLQNILVNVDRETGEFTEVKLADLGFACESQTLDSESNFCGSVSYMAPEMLLKNATYNEKIDIWSLGIILYELLTGEQLFHEEESDYDYDDLIDCIINKPLNFDNCDLSQEERKLLESMLQRDVSKRANS